MKKKMSPIGKLAYGPLKPRAINSDSLKSVKFDSRPKKNNKAKKNQVTVESNAETKPLIDTKRKLFKREENILRTSELDRAKEIINRHKNAK